MARSISDITAALIRAGWIPVYFMNCTWEVYEKCGICITVYNKLNVQICSRSNRKFNYVVPWDNIAELALSKFKNKEQFMSSYNQLKIKQLLEDM